MTSQGNTQDSCAYLAGMLGDPLLATATEATAWVLLEHAGPWGKDALADSDLAPEIVAEFKRRTAATGTRVQLVSPPAGAAPRRCFVAGDPPHAPPWLAVLPSADVASVLELDFAALAAGRRPAGSELIDDPLYVVCANDRSDPCCGRTGPPVFAAVSEHLGDRSRRTAHVGGHKYAANMVVFPRALFYGRLDPHSALDVITAQDSGRLYFDKYRGRSRYSCAEQAAEHFLRRERAEFDLDAVRLLGSRDLGDDSCAATFELPGGLCEVTVRAGRQGPPRLQSCSDEAPGRPVSWSMAALAEFRDEVPR